MEQTNDEAPWQKLNAATFFTQMNTQTQAVSLAAMVLCAVAVLSTNAQTSAKGQIDNSEATPVANIEKSIVKIYTSVRYPDYFRPWAKQGPVERFGTGVIIGGKRILSNAHVVQYATQIEIQPNQEGRKISAKIENVALDADLAVLKLEDETFFDSHPPVLLDKRLPDIREAVLVYGYPVGGSSLAVTKGIVSRIEFSPAVFSAGNLRVQIDAAVNPGNSGGPVIFEDKMAGLTSSRLESADNIGYFIPSEEIVFYLNDLADGKYDGKPAMFDELQTLENSALRSFLKLDASTTGMVVHKPNAELPQNPLRKWDVISHIGKFPINEQGKVTLSPNVQVNFSYLIQSLTKDGSFPLAVVRDGKELQIKMPTVMKRPALIQALGSAYPSYFIYGPLVFSTASPEFVQALRVGDPSRSVLGALTLGGSPLIRRMFDSPAFLDESLVIVSSPLFPHPLAKGYSNPLAQTVKTINGIPIKNLYHLVATLRDSKQEFITIEYDCRGMEAMVFPRKEMIEATESILTDNGVRFQGSADTLAVLNESPK